MKKLLWFICILILFTNANGQISAELMRYTDVSDTQIAANRQLIRQVKRKTGIDMRLLDSNILIRQKTIMKNLQSQRHLRILKRDHRGIDVGTPRVSHIRRV